MSSKTCFHDVNVENGAKMIEAFGYELPWEFTEGGNAEFIATRERASMVDLGYMAKFRITGPDATDFIQMLLTTDISKLKNGQIRYTAICDEQGKMIDDATIWKFKDNDYNLITGDEGDLKWIEKQAARYDVSIRNDTFNNGALQVQGPKAHDIMRKFTGVDPFSIKYYSFQEMTIDGRYVVTAKMSFTGSGGFEFHVDNKDARWLFETLRDIGKEFGMALIGQYALEATRQESGILLVGNDHNNTRNALEVGIAHTVMLGKADFIGKKALIKAAAEGVQKRIVSLYVTDGTEPRPGDTVMLQGTQIGVVTSGSYSATAKKGVALAFINFANAIPGLTYKIVIDGAEHDATLSLVPLHDPTYTIRRR